MSASLSESATIEARQALAEAILDCAAWLEGQGVPIPIDLAGGPKTKMAAMLEKFRAGMGLEEIRAEYVETLYSAMRDYLESGSPITRFRNSFRRAVNDGFTLAFTAGYADAGGAGEAMAGEDADWLRARIEAEIGFADVLFQQLKALRGDKTVEMPEKLVAAMEHANGYARTLDGVYAEGKLRGDRNKMLTFEGDDGVESCATCQRLKGQSHRARWWVERGLVPEQGNANFDCGCWACAHGLFDDDGNVWAAGGGY